MPLSKGAIGKHRHFERFFIRGGGGGGSKKNRKLTSEIVLVLYKTEKYTYIHHPHTDKRLDEWVENACLRPLGSKDSEEELDEFIDDVYSISEEEMGVTIVRNCEYLTFGRWMLKCWYYSPYPFPSTDSFVDTLWVCPLCLLYYTHENDYSNHCASCSGITPGSLVYKSNKLTNNSSSSTAGKGKGGQTEQYQLSIRCLDGKNDKLYAQNLCLLGKLFIDHKTIMYDLEPFLLYVLFRTRTTDNYSEVVGFFSKEKVSPEFHTLSCILVFPQHQQNGYGRLLMEFSYEIYKKQGFMGGPERPLSDLGLLGYFNYWKSVLLCLFYENPKTSLTLEEVCKITAFRSTDVLYTLDKLDLLQYWTPSSSKTVKSSARSRSGFAIPYQCIVDLVDRDFPKRDGRKERFKRVFEAEFVVHSGFFEEYM